MNKSRTQNKTQGYIFSVILLIIPLLLLSSCGSCNCTEESLDEIKAFKPDDKYFKSSLVSLHFMMEVDAVSGASYSLHRFRLAMTIALMKAII